MTFEDGMETIVRSFEIAGVIVLTLGSAAVVAGSLWTLLKDRDGPAAYRRTRKGLGRVILLGLEILIIADIVLTITIEATLQGVATLGLLVLVRTFLSFSIEIEVDGIAPWRRRDASRAASA